MITETLIKSVTLGEKWNYLQDVSQFTSFRHDKFQNQQTLLQIYVRFYGRKKRLKLRQQCDCVLYVLHVEVKVFLFLKMQLAWQQRICSTRNSDRKAGVLMQFRHDRKQGSTRHSDTKDQERPVFWWLKTDGGNKSTYNIMFKEVIHTPAWPK